MGMPAPKKGAVVLLVDTMKHLAARTAAPSVITVVANRKANGGDDDERGQDAWG